MGLRSLDTRVHPPPFPLATLATQRRTCWLEADAANIGCAVKLQLATGAYLHEEVAVQFA